MMKWILAVAVSICFSACHIYQEVKFEKVRQLQFDEFDNTGIRGTLKVTIENPNWFSVEITSADIDLGLQGRKVARVNLAESILVPKHSKNEYLLKISGTDAQLDAAILSAFSILFSDEIIISGEGYVEGKALKIKRKLPLEFEYPIKKSDLRKKKP